jgi:hypothetical protein
VEILSAFSSIALRAETLQELNKASILLRKIEALVLQASFEIGRAGADRFSNFPAPS